MGDKFAADGFGTQRYDLMCNDFVILGPAADPASIRSMTDVTAAFHKIGDSRALLVTRGDKSGTHLKELVVRKKSSVATKGNWHSAFEEDAKRNCRPLACADEKHAYPIMTEPIHHYEIIFLCRSWLNTMKSF